MPLAAERVRSRLTVRMIHFLLERTIQKTFPPLFVSSTLLELPPASCLLPPHSPSTNATTQHLGPNSLLSSRQNTDKMETTKGQASAQYPTDPNGGQRPVVDW